MASFFLQLTLLCAISTRIHMQQNRSRSTNMKEAILLMTEIDEENKRLLHLSTIADFEYSVNLTSKENKKKLDELSGNHSAFYTEALQMAANYNWKTFENKNHTLYRWFKLLFLDSTENDSPEHDEVEISTDDVEPSDDEIHSRNDTIQSWKDEVQSRNHQYYRSSSSKKSMPEIFQDAKVCPYNSSDKCTLDFYSDIEGILASSRDQDELRYYWKKYRDATGKKMRNLFIEEVEDGNEYAKRGGFKDKGDTWLKMYESETFLEDMVEQMSKVMPLYEQIHAYVRGKLKKYYNDVYIKGNGPIPAHLLGNMYAQVWSNIFDIVNPYPDKIIPDITEWFIEKEIKPLDLYELSEEFYQSIGLDRMTPSFWRYSLFEKPLDREVDCHGSAHNMYDGRDFRIKYCTEVHDEVFDTVVHEMGHIQYFMLYSKQPSVFQQSANPGFHEAVEALSLSVKTFDFLKKIGYLKDDYEANKETEIAFLLKTALKYVPSLPYDYIIDLYRYGVFNGSIKYEELNKMWWQYRFDFQGLCPPVTRTENDWDPGAKFHFANDIEYMRYYVANLFVFQIHKSLCKEAKVKGPLHVCSIYRKKRAGALLRKVLSLGRSVHWMKFVEILSGNETNSIDAEPLLEYFEPLMKWLKKENKGKTIGWKSSNVMRCPPEKSKEN